MSSYTVSHTRDTSLIDMYIKHVSEDEKSCLLQQSVLERDIFIYGINKYYIVKQCDEQFAKSKHSSCVEFHLITNFDIQVTVDDDDVFLLTAVQFGLIMFQTMLIFRWGPDNN